LNKTPSHRLIQLLLVFLLLWNIQNIAHHTVHHLTQSTPSCQFCHASKQFDLGHHETSYLVFDETATIEIRTHEEKTTPLQPLHSQDKPQITSFIYPKGSLNPLKPLLLGYFSTAPPLSLC